MITNIYLIPTENGYRAEAAWNTPVKGAILLTREHVYPVSIWAKRLTKNLRQTWHFETANSQHELICKLNALGREGAAIYRLWECYEESDKMMSAELQQLFDRCVQIRHEAYKKFRKESIV